MTTKTANPPPAYVVEDAARLAARPEIRQWAARFVTYAGPIHWLDFDAACHVRGFSGAGKTAQTLFSILYGLEPVRDRHRLGFRQTGGVS